MKLVLKYVLIRHIPIFYSGTVTPQPQAGNEKPRVFRLTEDRAIINRFVQNLISFITFLFFLSSYGFNNDGYEAVRARLIEYRQRSAANQDSKHIFRINNIIFIYQQ